MYFLGGGIIVFKTIQHTLASVALIKQIAVGLVIGILIAVCFPAAIPVVKIFGDLFVKALKGVAPVLVFFLVMNAMAQRKENGNGSMKPIIGLYVMATFFASLVGVCMSFLFPTTLHLQVAADTKLAPPSGIIQVLHNLILSVVDNPVNALLSANYIGILAWAIIIGIAMKNIASGTTKGWLDDVAKTITKVVTWVIHFARSASWVLSLTPSALPAWKRSSAMYSFWRSSSVRTSWSLL